jgi:hypothetical protein
MRYNWDTVIYHRHKSLTCRFSMSDRKSDLTGVTYSFKPKTVAHLQRQLGDRIIGNTTTVAFLMQPTMSSHSLSRMIRGLSNRILGAKHVITFENIGNNESSFAMIDRRYCLLLETIRLSFEDEYVFILNYERERGIE